MITGYKTGRHGVILGIKKGVFRQNELGLKWSETTCMYLGVVGRRPIGALKRGVDTGR